MEGDNGGKVKRPSFAYRIEKIGIGNDAREADEKSNEVEQVLNDLNKQELIDYIMYLRSSRAFFREDRLKLQILDNVDFTIWACDRDLKIRLWEGSCEKVYSIKKEDAIGENYLELFVSSEERHQSKEDTLEIIDTSLPQPFRLCDDTDGRGFPIQVITQCCRIEDDEEIELHDGSHNKYLQAEMAINMNYENLLAESKKFKRIQESFEEDVEQQRKDCLEVLQTSKDRILEVADSRINHYYHITSKGRTSSVALNAIQKLIDYRKDFLSYAHTQSRVIKSKGCFCDLTSDAYLTGEYTFDNMHSFDCICRHNRQELIEWRKKIEDEELNYQIKIAEVQLSSS